MQWNGEGSSDKRHRNAEMERLHLSRMRNQIVENVKSVRREGQQEAGLQEIRGVCPKRALEHRTAVLIAS